MQIELGYGKEKINVEISKENLQQLLKPNTVAGGLTGVEAVKEALQCPIGTPRLKNMVQPGEKICIVTSDITRPMPSKTVLPLLLDELYGAGCKDSDICVVFALGNHRMHTDEEKKQLVGESIFKRINCIDTDQNNVVDLGTTSFGTPVEIFRPVAEADRVICLGNIEYHYFAGYSGGAKAIMPGVSTAKAIQANHKRMVEETSATGNIDTNQVRQDIEEAAQMQRIDFILNVVLDEKKQIVKAVAGHYIEAHRAGCHFLDMLYKIPVSAKADVVVVSAGGFPKDINLYQAQKALDNSKHAVKDGGTIILVAECKEGLGEKVFEKWMREAKTPESMVDKIQQRFELGGHKAAAIGMIQMRTEVVLVSAMPESFVKELFFKPAGDLQTAVDKAILTHGQGCSVIVMPYGGSTLPAISK